MKSHLNKLLTIISLICLFALTACGTSYKVEGEEDAIKIYTCPADNMFGLEKVVVFEDRVIAVFDKEISDDSEWGDMTYNEKYITYPANPILSNVSKSVTTISTIEETDDKYIVTMGFEYDETNKIIPEEPVEVIGFSVLSRHVDFNGDDLKLSYTDVGCDCFEDYWQDYSARKHKFGKIEHKTRPCNWGVEGE